MMLEYHVYDNVDMELKDFPPSSDLRVTGSRKHDRATVSHRSFTYHRSPPTIYIILSNTIFLSNPSKIFMGNISRKNILFLLTRLMSNFLL